MALTVRPSGWEDRGRARPTRLDVEGGGTTWSTGALNGDGSFETPPTWFKAVLYDEASVGVRINRYLHLNPVRVRRWGGHES
ncbi:MAG TPA: hypothetical protein VGD78_14590 [Chthoniobacterales bacterium]